MEVIIKIVAIGLISCIATIIVRPIRADFSIFIAMTGGIVIICLIINYLTGIFATFQSLISLAGINSGIYGLLIKIMGIGYLIEFTAGICHDSGNSSLADKVLLGGKIIIMVMALPIVLNIIEIITGILPK